MSHKQPHFQNSSRLNFSKWMLALILSVVVLALAACGGTPAATVTQALPGLSLGVPVLPGSLVDMGENAPVSTLQEAAACLSTGQPVYGVVVKGGAVAAAPAGDGCRVGTVALGDVVHIDAILGTSDLADSVQLLASMDERAAAWPLGYEEDVQPIFKTMCVNCHGDALQSAGLKVIDYDSLMAGSQNGPVVIPGAPQKSKLWSQIHRKIMPLVGELTPIQRATVNAWIAGGALETRPAADKDRQLWLNIDAGDYAAQANSCAQADGPANLVSSELIALAACGSLPTSAQVADLLPEPPRPVADQAPSSATTSAPAASASSSSPKPQAAALPAGQLGISTTPLGISAPSEADGWMQPQGGFCVEQRMPQLQDVRGITSLAFAPDGRLFVGLDSPTTGSPDPLVLFDAYHPSRSIEVYDAVGNSGSNEILAESSRVTGMAYSNGALYLNRAGEVGRIPDGGGYEKLAGGFAVQGRLFHANNGIAILNGWLYVSAGGIRDGYSDGIVNPGDESIALDMVTGGNQLAARLVRAPVDQLVAQRSTAVFQTAARGFRNPYGLAKDPYGRLWVTDNGATNMPGDYSAGDEVNLFEPAKLSGAAAAGDETATPFYGFPIALAGNPPGWYTPPVLPLYNASAPTGITWAYNTIFYAQYGRDPGVYRLSVSGGRAIAERILFVWPVQAMATAPDGALWIGTGSGGLYRITPGCN